MNDEIIERMVQRILELEFIIAYENDNIYDNLRSEINDGSESELLLRELGYWDNNHIEEFEQKMLESYR